MSTTKGSMPTAAVLTLSVSEFKARCLEMIETVASTGRPIVLTRRDKVVAQVVPAAPDGPAPQDSLRGTFVIEGDIVGPVLTDDWEMLSPEAPNAPVAPAPKRGAAAKRPRPRTKSAARRA